MPLIASHSALVRNAYYDSAADADVFVYTELSDGVSFYEVTTDSVAQTGLRAGNGYKLRVFEGVTRPDKPYLSPTEWEDASAAEKAAHWTLRPGDKVSCNGRFMTITSVHDNRAGRVNPHWVLEAK